MKKPRRLLLSLVVIGLVMGFSLPAVAEYYTICGKEISLEGYIRQEFAFNVNESSDYKTNQTGLHSAYQIWYLDTGLELNQNLEARMILRLWGDLIYQLRSNSDHFDRYFKSSKKNLNWDDDFDQIFREFHITYSTPKFLLKLGKQQIGWGEADGLRVMDIINPLDARRDFLFYDTEGFEEVRIPKWMLKTEFYPGNIGPFLDTAVELYWNPGDIREFGELLPPMADAHLVGGVYGAWPTGIPKQWGAWGAPTPFAPLPVRLYKKERATKIDNSEYGTRFKFSCKDTFVTLNYWQGFSTSDHEVIKFRGLMPDGGGILIPGGPPFPMALAFDRIWKRIKVAGFTLNREIFGVGNLTGQTANPVLRAEALYSFDETFNTRESFFPFGPAGPPGMLFKTTDKDQLRYMVGFDWSMNLKFINPKKSTFVSGQFFHIHTFNYTGGARALLQLAPYDWRFPENQFYTTLLIRTEYMNERVVPSILYAQDYHTKAAWVKSKVYFRIGDHWRPEIGYLWVGRNCDHTQTQTVPGVGPVTMSDDYKSFGLFEDRDQIWIRIQYQF
ncbi:MAG: DUF1302 family protein [Pseudomonadota bacterium]